MTTPQELIEKKRIIEEAKRGIAKERREKVKTFANKVVKNVRNADYKRAFQSTGSRPKQGNVMQKFFMPQSSQGNKTGKVGRPRGIFQWRSPISGKPIPATQYYKELRFVKRYQENLAKQRLIAYQQELAKRGINPQQAQQIQMQRAQQPQQPQQPIQPQQPQQRSIWNRQGWVESDWGLFGRRQVVRGTPQAMWN